MNTDTTSTNTSTAGYMLAASASAAKPQHINIAISYKEMEKGKGKHPTVHVQVPALDLSGCVIDAPAGIETAVREALELVRRDLVRDLIEALRKSGTAEAPCNPIGHYLTDSQINLESVVRFANEQAVSQRLSTDSIGNWFDSYLAPSIVLALVAKGSTDVECAAKLASWREAFSKLAAVSPRVPRSDAEKLVRTLALASVTDESGTSTPVRDAVYEALSKRLDSIINPKSVVALALDDI